MRPAWIVAALLAGVFIGEAHTHIKPTQWGWVWQLEPAPDWPQGLPGVPPDTQLVRCPNGDLVLPPWHVRVLWDDDAALSTVFLQERGQ